MKNFRFILAFSALFLSISCDLDEDPIFLDETLYDTPESAAAALDGIYQKITSYNVLERRLFVLNGYSGLFNTKKNGNNVNNINNVNLFSLKPTFDPDTEAMWGGLYSVIVQCNAAIENITIVENAIADSDVSINDIAGQAYFIRAWSYFSLVRLFGEIPLRLKLPNPETINIAKSSLTELYAQLIIDTNKAINLMNGSRGIGYPKKNAANFLLAKIYMTMATNPELRPTSLTELDCWNLSYGEAIEVYEEYELVSDYASLFTIEGENSSESIFELQVSQLATNSQMGRNYTPSNYKPGQAYGWFKVNASVYDEHKALYPSDSRLIGTYISEYTNVNNGTLSRTYPTNAGRNNYNAGHPYFFKFSEKNRASTNQYGSQNVIVYRYAELLLMLAEISNELDNNEQLRYVEEVLIRSGNTPHAGYTSGVKDEFREAIMAEYRYELLGEGEDAFHNRRRGYNYFLTHTISNHNNSTLKTGVDLILNTEESQVMYLPIPLIEVNTNELIN